MQSAVPLYPLRFEPIFQYRPWGGRRLANLLSTPLPGNDPIGEAWILSDRDDHTSRVASGPLQGHTIQQLLEAWPQSMLGSAAGRFSRFPLLLKFLDVSTQLSVQVHPSGEQGKTEAWVVLEAGLQSRIYAGLTPGSTAENLRCAISQGKLADHLESFTPVTGDGVFVAAGTVHSLSDVVVFEVQQNSDLTFRLYDWDHVDPKTAQLRPLQVDQAMACIAFPQSAVRPVDVVTEERQPVLRERIFRCAQFGVWRISGASPFVVGAAGTARVLVCTAGEADLEHDGLHYPFGKGEVLLLAAEVGACICRAAQTVSLLEISLPESA